MNKKLKFEKLKPEHSIITPYLRQEDINEMKALTGIKPELGVAYSIAFSQRGGAAIYDDKTAAIFGVSDDLIWLLGTDEITKHPITFFRASREYLPKLLRGYDYVYNYVDSRNKLHLDWLKWLGFTIEEAQLLGVENRPFHKVWKEISNVY